VTRAAAPRVAAAKIDEKTDRISLTWNLGDKSTVAGPGADIVATDAVDAVATVVGVFLRNIRRSAFSAAAQQPGALVPAGDKGRSVKVNLLDVVLNAAAAATSVRLIGFNKVLSNDGISALCNLGRATVTVHERMTTSIG
jgi:hypothetical protein